MSQENSLHKFSNSLKTSHAASDLPFWWECYLEVYPMARKMMDYRFDEARQAVGIDRGIILPSGREITFDEKVRFKNWPDILLEEWGDKDRGFEGWATKSSLECDYIAYAIAPAGICYFLPRARLQLAWRSKAEQWKAKSGWKPRLCHNDCWGKQWTSVNWPIEVDVLFRTVGGCMSAKFTPHVIKD